MNKNNRLVEIFTLRGVHGYKDITVNFAGPATIVVAENGTGKTTLLGALNAFLSKRFQRLAAFSFHTLECKFFDDDDMYYLVRSEIAPAVSHVTDAIRAIARNSQLGEEEVSDFIQNVYAPERFDQLLHTSLLHTIYMQTPGGPQETRTLMDDAYGKLNNFLSPALERLRNKLRVKLEGVEILYLPTYRRIERPMLRPNKKAAAERASLVSRSRGEQPQHAYDGIAFGLGDIQARLGELSEEIERSSNFGYRTLSARMLEDMLKNTSSDLPIGPDQLPEVKTLSLFLGRLGRVENNLGHIFSNIGDLYESRAIYQEKYRFLRYFLIRLNSVIDETKTMEQRIQRFVNACNGYLTMSSDEKQLAFDPRTLKVVVQNLWADCIVPLDALSSGEKQIISLMAKLHLDEKEKIVLIDEPELSLSLDWQRKVLPDVMNSGSVMQMLAITHSPFVFENELDPFATGMSITRNGGVQLDLNR